MSGDPKERHDTDVWGGAFQTEGIAHAKAAGRGGARPAEDVRRPRGQSREGKRDRDRSER